MCVSRLSRLSLSHQSLFVRESSLKALVALSAKAGRERVMRDWGEREERDEMIGEMRERETLRRDKREDEKREVGEKREREDDISLAGKASKKSKKDKAHQEREQETHAAKREREREEEHEEESGERRRVPLLSLIAFPIYKITSMTTGRSEAPTTKTLAQESHEYALSLSLSLSLFQNTLRCKFFIIYILSLSLSLSRKTLRFSFFSSLIFSLFPYLSLSLSQVSLSAGGS